MTSSAYNDDAHDKYYDLPAEVPVTSTERRIPANLMHAILMVAETREHETAQLTRSITLVNSLRVEAILRARAALADSTSGTEEQVA